MYGGIKFLNNDARNLDVENNSIDLIITSPPYYGIDTFRYGGDNKTQINYVKNDTEYIENMIESTKEMYRVLKSGGSLLINIGYPMCHRYFVEILEKTKFNHGTTYILDYSESVTDLENIVQSYQLWFHFYKGSKFFINPFVFKKNPGLIIKSKFNNLDNEKEKILSKFGYVGDSLNMDLAEYFVKLYTKKNDTILDPFGGSGAVALSSIKNNRECITNDISLDAIELSKKRMEVYLGENYKK